MGELLERTLKRLAQRKTAPRKKSEVQTVINQYYSYEKAVTALRDSLAKDFVSALD
jgi:hypothetical protein